MGDKQEANNACMSLLTLLLLAVSLHPAERTA